MKYLFSFLLLNFGFILAGFSQDLEILEPKNIPLRSVPKSIQPELELPRYFSPEILLVDSTKAFRPEGLFQEKFLKINPMPEEKSTPGIYPLPDPQSRMPIKTFDDSVNYTILIKEYK